MKDYEINDETMALIQLGEEKTKIIEEDKEYVIDKSAYSIMDDRCKYFGSSYLGRVEGSKNMIGYEYKLPIIVEESRKLIFFPTSSPYSEDCSWISLKHVDNIEKNDNNTILVFKNGTKVKLNVSKASFNNQLLRSTRLESVLNARKEK